MSKISPCLGSTARPRRRRSSTPSLLPDLKITHVQKNPVDSPAGKAGSVLVVEFTLAGQSFMALNGGTPFDFTHAISLSIDCADEAEVDRLGRASEGGTSEQCGWLKDRYGVSWQIVRPRSLGRPHRRRAARDAGDDGDGEARYRRIEAGL